MLWVVTLSVFFPSLRRSSVVWASPVMAERATSGASRRSALISSSPRFDPERCHAYLIRSFARISTEISVGAPASTIASSHAIPICCLLPIQTCRPLMGRRSVMPVALLFLFLAALLTQYPAAAAPQAQGAGSPAASALDFEFFRTKAQPIF